MTGEIKIKFAGREVQEKRVSIITLGSVETVKAIFEFDEEWDGFEKTAIFSSGDTIRSVLLDNTGVCTVPWEVLTDCKHLTIGVVGMNGSRVLPSVRVIVSVSDGIYTSGTAPAAPTPDVYEQLVALAQQTQSIAQSVRADADDGKFDGAQGEKGEKGDTGADGKTPVKGLDYFTNAEIEAIKEAAKSVIELNAEASRHNRDIVLMQDGEEVGRVTAAGQKNGQSWLFTDYTNSSISGDFSSSFGFNNRIFGNGNSVFGIRNSLTGRGVVLAGTGNTVLRCAEGAIICGRNLYIDDPMIIFAAGVGDSIFWVKTDGTYGGK